MGAEPVVIYADLNKNVCIYIVLLYKEFNVKPNKGLIIFMQNIIRAQARKAQGPIVFLRILFFFFIFYRLSGHFWGA